MLDVLNNYDWESAFGYASPQKCVSTEDVSVAAFTRQEVKAIYWRSDGENDGDAWIIGGELADGRLFFLAAWCDYTGWDCQAGGSAWVSRSVKTLVRFGIDDGQRSRLNIAIVPPEVSELT